MSTGQIRFFCDTPSPDNATAAVMKLEVNGINVPITDDCGGLRQFFNAIAALGCYDAEAVGGGVGGTTPNGVDSVILFLHSPIDVPPLQKTFIDLGALTLQIAHQGAYGIRFDSMMASEFWFKGGQLVLQPTAQDQKGWWFNPRNELSNDLAGPVITASYVNIGSTVGVRDKNQQLVRLDSADAPIIANEGFVFTEPNAGDRGVVVRGSYGFIGNSLDVWGAHGQKNGCIDVGPGACGNMIRAIVAPEPTAGTGLDYWGKDDIIDLQVIPGDSGNGWRGITLENGSSNLQCRMGRNVAATQILNGSGAGHPSPNIINGTSYQN